MNREFIGWNAAIDEADVWERCPWASIVIDAYGGWWAFASVVWDRE